MPLAVIAVLGLAGAAVSGVLSSETPQSLLSGARCADAALRQLLVWSAALDRAIPDPPGPLGARTTRVPTDVIGVWVRLMVDPPGEVVLERVTASAIEVWRLGAGCEPEVASRAVLPPSGAGFTDEALAARLAQGDSGVILLWSPHMPLSVDQHDVLVEVAADLGLAVIAVLDPAADAGYAREVADARRLPLSSLRHLDGIELAFRGMTTHAPSVQVFAGGRLVGPVLYGYRSHTAARLAIERVLAGH